MKKFLLFLFGVIVGVVGTYGTLWFIAQSQSQDEGLRGLTIFGSPTDCVTKSNLRVIQVQKSNMALAVEEKDVFFSGLVVLLVNRVGKSYYDNEKITIPKGKCARQIGVFQYENKEHDWKTVPVVDVNL